MFFPGSRYLRVAPYSLTLADGRALNVTRFPLPRAERLLGLHRRLEGQRLDLLANAYLKDATAAHRLCDANGSIAPDALAVQELIAIPVKGG